MAFADACPSRQARGVREPEPRLDVGVAVPGEDGPALLFEGLADDLDREVVELPAGDQAELSQGQVLRLHEGIRGHIDQAPGRQHRRPRCPAGLGDPAHGHPAGKACVLLRDAEQTLLRASGEDRPAGVVENLNEVRLAFAEKGQMLQRRPVRLVGYFLHQEGTEVYTAMTLDERVTGN